MLQSIGTNAVIVLTHPLYSSLGSSHAVQPVSNASSKKAIDGLIFSAYLKVTMMQTLVSIGPGAISDIKIVKRLVWKVFFFTFRETRQGFLAQAVPGTSRYHHVQSTAPVHTG